MGRWRAPLERWLTVVPDVFENWNAPRRIVHLTSTDLKRWQCSETLDLGAEGVIDASVARLAPNHYRLWYTRVGRFIRTTSIGELPQLINILADELSLVSPRPHALGSTVGDERFWRVGRQYWDRYALSPTSPASGRSAVPAARPKTGVTY